MRPTSPRSSVAPSVTDPPASLRRLEGSARRNPSHSSRELSLWRGHSGAPARIGGGSLPREQAAAGSRDCKRGLGHKILRSTSFFFRDFDPTRGVDEMAVVKEALAEYPWCGP